jgi:hypothetical protein
MRRIISCTLASLIGACVLMIAPASGLAFEVAGGGEICPGSCLRYEPNVEVTTAESSISYSMRIPRLPQRAVVANYLVRQDFRQLAAISGTICRISRNFQKSESPAAGVYPAVTGFVPQLAQFNSIRRELSAILQNYNLGFAPDITDFSDVSTLTYNYSIEVRSRHRNYVVSHAEETGLNEIYPFSESGCTFALV